MKQSTEESKHIADWKRRILHLLHKADAEQLRSIYYLIKGYLGI